MNAPLCQSGATCYDVVTAQIGAEQLYLPITGLFYLISYGQTAYVNFSWRLQYNTPENCKESGSWLPWLTRFMYLMGCRCSFASFRIHVTNGIFFIFLFDPNKWSILSCHSTLKPTKVTTVRFKCSRYLFIAIWPPRKGLSS